MNIKSKKIDILVVGAGFAGVYLTYKLRENGFSVQTIEAGQDVGGTWYWNRYPGARCDVPSVEYSYSFSRELEKEWTWSEKYSPQPEILKYIQHVADRFDIRKDILFNTRVVSAHYNEQEKVWIIKTDDGNYFEASYFILATGNLSVPRLPNFKNLKDFNGEFYHTGDWPTTPVNFKGKRVAVIGTGSSGIQSIPVIAEDAKHLTVFIKDSNYTLPAGNQLLTPEFTKEVKNNYPDLRKKARQMWGGILFNSNPTVESVSEALKGEERRSKRTLGSYSSEEVKQMMEEKYLGTGLGFVTNFPDIQYDLETDVRLREYLNNRIYTLVKDPKKASALIPKSEHYADRRPVIDTNYYQTFNKKNVNIVDVNEEPIQEFYERGIRTTQHDYEYDIIVCATGFDAMTGAINKIDIVGREGQVLKEKWSAGPRTYLGLMSNSFPNMFMIAGAGSPSVFCNMVLAIEQHVEWVSDCISYMREKGKDIIEPILEQEDEWVDHCIDVAQPLFVSKGDSWYVGANVPGKPRVFMAYIAGMPNYIAKCEEVVNNNYEGFIIH
ncbi:Phenylacetone monooxygenase [Chryseobacterium nakagawai]|uniref:NAD(P)/FAD-dependent oxidoreductase n=1 Tax=Chryseobacterium nakagawai TaxID=1241982 RepID=A0AAD0YRG7_CHRNA|nr:NAD(P)/FAD-dependent oxidoreductase [Chryseobacterium nakagawai]AZA93610.1 NAD(P)/FAD-dependent oxidoreductase [Chryseobacterium nakagawai]VEH20310.1 Phenylacetone monooxygenase [Chryseobacterium nakagawai]